MKIRGAAGRTPLHAEQLLQEELQRTNVVEVMPIIPKPLWNIYRTRQQTKMDTTRKM